MTSINAQNKTAIAAFILTSTPTLAVANYFILYEFTSDYQQEIIARLVYYKFYLFFA